MEKGNIKLHKYVTTRALQLMSVFNSNNIWDPLAWWFICLEHHLDTPRL